jgi:hypothetical protein
MQLAVGNSWTFTTGGFASFNTSSIQTSTTNTMRINGVDYASGRRRQGSRQDRDDAARRRSRPA